MKGWVKWLLGFGLIYVLAQMCGVSGDKNTSSSRLKGVEKSVRVNLAERRNESIHVTDVKFVKEEDGTLTYEWAAEMKTSVGLRIKESGMIYFYDNGDFKDFVEFNSAEVIQ